MKDILGREISVGDYVAYPTTSSHSPVMMIGVVVSLEREDFQGRTWVEGEWRPKTIEHWKIAIKATLESGRWARGAHKAIRNSYPNWRNVIKIDPPEESNGDPVLG